MKTGINVFLTVFILTALLALSGCTEPVSTTEGGTTGLYIRFDTGMGTGRTAVPDISAEIDRFVVTLIPNFVGAAQQSITIGYAASAMCPFSNLLPGSYTINVSAFGSSGVVGTGSSVISLASGQILDTVVVITLTGTDGEIDLTITYPPSIGVNAIYCNIYSYGTASPIFTNSFFSGGVLDVRATNVTPGAYELEVIFEDAAAHTLMTLREVVNVAPGLITDRWIGPGGTLLTELALQESDFFSTNADLSAFYCSLSDTGTLVTSELAAGAGKDLGPIPAESFSFSVVGSVPGQRYSYSLTNGSFSSGGNMVSGETITLGIAQNGNQNSLVVSVVSPSGVSKVYRLNFNRGIRVRYFGNGNSGGTVPAESNIIYNTLLNLSLNTGNLVKQDGPISLRMDRWGILKTDGTFDYFTLPTILIVNGYVDSSQTVNIYAQWTSIGARGPGNGYVFYDKGYVSDGWRYLEVDDSGGVGDIATSFSSNNNQWIGSTSLAIGTGKRNTELALNQQTTPGGAITQCDNFYQTGINGSSYRDWFLPSLDELALVYDNICDSGIDVFAAPPDNAYWTSSEYSNNESRVVGFTNGVNSYKNKSQPPPDTVFIRPVRAFRSDRETWIVTYFANKPAGTTMTGSVPVDTSYYEAGDTAHVLGNTGEMSVTGAGTYTFNGWSTLPGGGTFFVPGSPLFMPAYNVVLYAQWLGP